LRHAETISVGLDDCGALRRRGELA
jgi:hypothetical protein